MWIRNTIFLLKIKFLIFDLLYKYIYNQILFVCFLASIVLLLNITEKSESQTSFCNLEDLGFAGKSPCEVIKLAVSTAFKWWICDLNSGLSFCVKRLSQYSHISLLICLKCVSFDLLVSHNFKLESMYYFSIKYIQIL